jgi:hypothetical protein
MAYRLQDQLLRFHSLIFLICLCTVLLITTVSGYGYSNDYEGYLGETIALHGESYNSDQIYLFMTGPGLPENGVALTDTTQRAEQGQFTTVGVDSSQQWSFKWDTSRIENQIDPGTYTIYAVNAPVDKSDLAGHSYQTLTAYLKDGMLSKDRVSTGGKYTVNLAYDDTPTIATTITTAPPTLPPTTIVPETIVTTALPTTAPTKKSAALPVYAIVALVAGCIVILRRNKE